MSAAPTVILHTNAPGPALSVLAETHPDLTVHVCQTYEGLADLIERTGAEIVYSVRFAGTPSFPRKPLTQSSTVKWVSVGGSGTDHLQPWDPVRLTVTNAAGVAADMMAEYALGGMLAFSLGLPGFLRRQKERQWGPATVEPIQGRTVLILGLGKTGQAVAWRCKTMGMATLGVRAEPRATRHVDEVHAMADLRSLWPRADFIVCCVPLTEETRGLVGYDAFAAMKPSAVLIDVSRGGVVDEAALLAALDAGRLKGAVLDVFATEPLPAEHPLWAYDKVIVTPHCSSIYEGWDVKCVQMFAENLARYRSGRPLENVVNPLRGY